MIRLFGSHDHGPLVSEQMRSGERSSYEFKRGYKAALKDVENAHRKGGQEAVVELVEKNLPHDYWM